MNRRLLAVSIVSIAIALPSFGAQNAPTGRPAAAPKTGYRAEVLSDLDEIQKKTIDLAAAMPQDKYRWRPGDGVRSVSEVYMHIAGANYLLPTFLGVKPPAGLTADMEKSVTERAKVVAELQRSFDHLRNVVLSLSDSDLDKQVNMFGQQLTERAVLMRILVHLHEHLGQSIAYARMNGVVPPWSKKES